MSAVSMTAGHGRLMALLLLLVSLIVGYFLLVHWWFTEPLMAARTQFLDLREQEQRLRATAQQAPQVDALLGEVTAFEQSNPGFLTEANFDLAASALIQRLQTAVDEQGAGERCVVVSRNAFRNRDEEPFQRVTIQVRLRCELEYLLPVLHGLESGSPQLFIGDLGIVARRSPPQAGQPARAGYVDVSFNLYGYIRERGAKA